MSPSGGKAAHERRHGVSPDCRDFLPGLALVLLLAGCSDSTPAAPEAEVALRLPQRKAKTPALVAETPAIADAAALLRKVVHDHGRDPDIPWAVCHAILALGPGIELTNGRGAVDFLFSEYADVTEASGEKLIGFPLRTKRVVRDPESGARKSIDVLVEPHPEIVLKVLTERGVEPGRPVHVDGGTYSLDHLYRNCMHRIWVDGNRVAHLHWNNLSWALQALATWAPESMASSSPAS